LVAVDEGPEHVVVFFFGFERNDLRVGEESPEASHVVSLSSPDVDDERRATRDQSFDRRPELKFVDAKELGQPDACLSVANVWHAREGSGDDSATRRSPDPEILLLWFAAHERAPVPTRETYGLDSLRGKRPLEGRSKARRGASHRRENRAIGSARVLPSQLWALAPRRKRAILA
jgi:hypothetical protein